MKIFWFFSVVILALSNCKARNSQTKVQDAFIESPTDGKHQVVYLDNDTVYRVFCGTEHRYPTKTLTRNECSHTNSTLKFERLNYTSEYKPQLKQYLDKLGQNSEAINQEVVYLKATLENLNQRLAEEPTSSDRTDLEQEIKNIESRLSIIEPQSVAANLFDVIVGSADRQKKGILDISEKFKDYAVSSKSKAIVAPFNNTPSSQNNYLEGVCISGPGGIGRITISGNIMDENLDPVGVWVTSSRIVGKPSQSSITSPVVISTCDGIEIGRVPAKYYKPDIGGAIIIPNRPMQLPGRLMSMRRISGLLDGDKGRLAVIKLEDRNIMGTIDFNSSTDFNFFIKASEPANFVKKEDVGAAIRIDNETYIGVIDSVEENIIIAKKLTVFSYRLGGGTGIQL